RRAGLFSVPARFGVRGSLWISALLHTAMLLLLAWLPRLYHSPGPPGPPGSLGPPGLGLAYWVGWAGCLALISYQHAVVRPRDVSRLDAAFFEANGAVSVWLFGATAVAILWP